MDSISKILAHAFEALQPKATELDPDRDAVELVWNANLYDKDFGVKELMLRAYRHGKLVGRTDGLKIALAKMGATVADEPMEPDQNESIYDRDPVSRTTYAGDVDCQVTADRRAIARGSRA